MTDTQSATAAGIKTEIFSGQFVTFEAAKGTFSPTSSTIFHGEREAVLIDAQHIRSDVDALADVIEQTGRQLTTIYVTHSHADHWYGVGQLLKRFPSARAVATPEVIAHINKTASSTAKQWQAMFGDRVADPSAVPEPITDAYIGLEGNEIQIVEVEQGDICPTTVVHVPAVDTIVGADVVYNQIHAMLGLSTRAQWPAWLRSLDAIEALGAKRIVAGHRHPEASDWEPNRMLDETRSYISDFAEISASADNADELISKMKARYPTFGNPWTLHYSANAFFTARSR